MLRENAGLANACAICGNQASESVAGCAPDLPREALRVRKNRRQNSLLSWIPSLIRAADYGMPLLQFTPSQVADSHLSNGIGESSKTAPVLALNCL